MKACDLLCEGRVHLDVERAVVEGDTASYVVQLIGQTWTCGCRGYEYRQRCSHVEAVAMLTTPPQ